jgi:Tol biopolymer transport system component
MKRSIPRTFVCVVVALGLAAGCASPPKQPKAVKTVAFITNNTSDFWKIARKGCEKADAELSDVTVAFKTTNTGTVEEQNGLLRHALDAEDADAIAISLIDPSTQKTVINNAAKRALLVTQDSDAPDTDRLVYLGADNRAAGRQAGELIKKALPQGGKIMVFVGKREVQNAKDRFEGLKESLQGSNVVVIDLMTDDADAINARLTNNPALDDDPSWSPDGTKLVFWSSRNGNPEIYVMNANGTGQTRLTNNSAVDVQPEWSPDGSKIVFTSNRDGLFNTEIYVMNANGSGLTRLTRDRALNGSPDWSPDGTNIVFASNRTGLLDFEIWVMNANGANPVLLTTGPRASIGPSWSTDGSKIVFATNRDNLTNFEIYSMNANGSNPRRLTSNTVQDVAPNW